MVRLKNWGLVSITIITLKIVNFIFAQTAVKKERASMPADFVNSSFLFMTA